MHWTRELSGKLRVKGRSANNNIVVRVGSGHKSFLKEGPEKMKMRPTFLIPSWPRSRNIRVIGELRDRIFSTTRNQLRELKISCQRGRLPVYAIKHLIHHSHD